MAKDKRFLVQTHTRKNLLPHPAFGTPHEKQGKPAENCAKPPENAARNCADLTKFAETNILPLLFVLRMVL